MRILFYQTSPLCQMTNPTNFFVYTYIHIQHSDSIQLQTENQRRKKTEIIRFYQLSVIQIGLLGFVYIQRNRIDRERERKKTRGRKRWCTILVGVFVCLEDVILLYTIFNQVWLFVRCYLTKREKKSLLIIIFILLICFFFLLDQLCIRPIVIRIPIRIRFVMHFLTLPYNWAYLPLLQQHQSLTNYVLIRLRKIHSCHFVLVLLLQDHAIVFHRHPLIFLDVLMWYQLKFYVMWLHNHLQW